MPPSSNAKLTSGPKTEQIRNYEVARILNLEEVKAYCKQALALLNKVGDRLGQLLSDQFKDEDTLRDAAMPDLDRLLNYLKYPRPTGESGSSVIFTLNKWAKKTGRDPFTWEDVQTLYGVDHHEALEEAINHYKKEKSDESIAELLTCLGRVANGIEQFVEGNGGDSDRNLDIVLDDYVQEVHSEWHGKSFRQAETRQLAINMWYAGNRFGLKPNELNLDDIGCGVCRCAEYVCDIHRDGFEESNKALDQPIKINSVGPVQRDLALSRYHGLDLKQHIAQRGRQKLKALFHDPSKFDPSRIKVGNFHAHEKHGHTRHEPGSVHLAFSFMRTALHNTTEDRTHIFLKKASEELAAGNEERAGGILVFDSVGIGFNAETTDEERSQLFDLTNLHQQLNQAYRRRFNETLPEGLDYDMMPRFPTHEKVAGDHYCSREVLTRDYIDYIIEKYGLDLEYVGHNVVISDGFREINKDPDMRKRATELGRSWIKDYGLEEYYREVIQERIDTGLLSDSVLSGLNPDENQLEQILDYIAQRMVGTGFRSTFYVYRRPRKYSTTEKLDADEIAKIEKEFANVTQEGGHNEGLGTVRAQPPAQTTMHTLPEDEQE